MNEVLRQELNRTLQGNADLLSTFRLERLTLAGGYVVPGTPMWEERLTITGKGDVEFRTRRDLADAGGAEIGEFAVTRPYDVIMNLLNTIQRVPIDEVHRFSIGPNDLRTELKITLGKGLQEIVIGYNDPLALAPLQPLLQLLNGFASDTRRRAIAGLSLRLNAPAKVSHEADSLAVTLQFQNMGTQGFWLTHPSRIGNPTEAEQCQLFYVPKPQITPGITPVPAPIEEAILTYTEPQQQELVWFAPFGQFTYRFTATTRFVRKGIYQMRAIYAAYPGEDRIEAKIRLRGCVFSNEVEIEVT